MKVAVNGAVTINLPSARGVLAIPASFAMVPITIIDVGGFATAHPITINPSGTELISGLASIAIATNRGAISLRPNPTDGTWTALS